MNTHTIAAIASPPGSGGIGIIKISGPEAVKIATRTFCHHKKSKDIENCRNQTNTLTFQSHRLYYGHIIDPETGGNLDEVLLSVMRAPRSYTREDVVEIQAHAGPAVMRNILSLVVRQGARIAEPGEFTRRAFLNGRIDLTQAEAVIDLISARTDAAFQSASNQLSGRLRKVVESVRDNLTSLLVEIEAKIDFPEDMAGSRSDAKMEGILQTTVIEPIQTLIRNYNETHIYRDGFDLSIIGRPNVGKSSLLNRLVEKDRAIVNAVPGTTRDLVECPLQLQGIPVNIIDTAGIHTTEDVVENMGIQKTRACIEDTHLVVLVLDASEPVCEADQQVYEYCQNKSLIYVLNKIDLVNGKKYTPFSVPAHWKNAIQVRTSALHGTGIDQLKSLVLSEVVEKPRPPDSHSVIPNVRHQEALEKCHQNVVTASAGLRQDKPMELIAIDIYEALDHLNDILGVRIEADILDRIFSRFCIGK